MDWRLGDGVCVALATSHAVSSVRSTNGSHDVGPPSSLAGKGCQSTGHVEPIVSQREKVTLTMHMPDVMQHESVSRPATQVALLLPGNLSRAGATQCTSGSAARSLFPVQRPLTTQHDRCGWAPWSMSAAYFLSWLGWAQITSDELSVLPVHLLAMWQHCLSDSLNAATAMLAACGRRVAGAVQRTSGSRLLPAHCATVPATPSDVKLAQSEGLCRLSHNSRYQTPPPKPMVRAPCRRCSAGAVVTDGRCRCTATGRHSCTCAHAHPTIHSPRDLADRCLLAVCPRCGGTDSERGRDTQRQRDKERDKIFKKHINPPKKAAQALHPGCARIRSGLEGTKWGSRFLTRRALGRPGFRHGTLPDRRVAATPWPHSGRRMPGTRPQP